MSRFAIPARDDVDETTRPVLDAVNRRFGFVPNMHRLMSISPDVLSGFIGLQDPLSRALDVKTREGIALVVSEVNGSDYCLSTHTYIASNFGRVSPEECARNRDATSSDPKRAAAIRFAKKVVEARGKVSDSDIDEVRAAGYADREIIEIVALCVQYLMTNFMNNVAATDVDFPVVDSSAPRAAAMSSTATDPLS